MRNSTKASNLLQQRVPLRQLDYRGRHRHVILDAAFVTIRQRDEELKPLS
jgi:hypothetical protein